MLTNLSKNRSCSIGSIFVTLIKNKTKEVPISLEIVKLAEKLVQVKGEFFISRTEFDLGKGKWSSTAVLKDQVKIQISLFLFKE